MPASNRSSEDAEYSIATVLGEDGGDRRRFRICQIRIGESRYLEARIYYRNKDGEIAPTKKGVVITPSNYLLLRRVLDSHDEHSRQWLGLSFIPAEVTEKASSTESSAPSTWQPDHLDWRVENRHKSEGPFAIAYRGNRAEVCFNATHPWVAKLPIVQDSDAAKGIIRMLAELVVANDCARRRAAAQSDGDYLADLFHCQEIFLSQILHVHAERKQ